MRRTRFIVIFTLLAMAPPFVYRWVSAEDNRYSELVSRYECAEGVCNADFDGDGLAGQLAIEWRQDSGVPGDQWLIASDSGRELLRLPFWYADNTLRSHAAIRTEGGPARLLIYWGASRSDRQQTSVYLWDGQRMAEVGPVDADQEILSAMAARDNAGTFIQWLTFRFVRDYLLMGYYLLLGGAGIYLAMRSRKQTRPITAKI